MLGATPLAKVFKDNPSVKVVLPQPFEGSQFPAQTGVAEAKDAELVEGARFETRDVPELGYSGFDHFLDGAQRSWLVAYHGLYPIYYSVTCAAVLPRIERQVLPPDDQNYANVRAFFGYLLPSLPEFQELRSLADEVRSVGSGKDPSPADIGDKIMNAISDRRDELERKLAREFRGGALLVDGGIGRSLQDEADSRVVVGVVKSHRKQYFASEERASLVVSMKPGMRSSVFLREQGVNDDLAPYSFYLKLHDREGQGPFFGLVRVEMPPLEEFVDRADEIAGWILAERAPLSLPDPRYDRMLYPIRLVEQYLKSRLPSESAIRGLLGK